MIDPTQKIDRKTLICSEYKISCCCGTMRIKAKYYGGRLHSIEASLTNASSSNRMVSQTMAAIVTAELQHEVPLKGVIDSLENVHCYEDPSENKAFSCAGAIRHVLVDLEKRERSS